MTREELRRELWPDDTFVDFDNGLNVAIRKIRDAIGDLGAFTTVHRNRTRAGLPLHRAGHSKMPAPPERRALVPSQARRWPRERQDTSAPGPHE